MKIESLQFADVGPLRDRRLSFIDDWSGQIEARVLFSGPNGCGKSTVLRSVAMLWDAAGQWLDHQRPLPKASSAREWLHRWGGIAMVLRDTGFAGAGDGPVGLIFGEYEWCQARIRERSDALWLGEFVTRTGRPGRPGRGMALPPQELLGPWSEARKKMVLGFEPTSLPNVIFLDAEERRWVAPRRRVGEHLAEDPVMRWSPRYLATDDWRGQLESSLINLKVTQLHRFHAVLKELNGFLKYKRIESDIRPGENRLRVKLKGGRGEFHTLDELSAGEHQVLIILYLIARWAEKGCVVLIDEPDLYLHPSLIAGLLARVEGMVAELGGQLIITSHVPEVWSRYESTGRRIDLGTPSEHA